MRIIASAALAFVAIDAGAIADSGVTYVDLSGPDDTPVRAGPNDTLRFFVVGGGCRVPSLDLPPAVGQAAVEFTLTFNSGCFATQPGFRWTGDIVAPAAGVYEVRYFRRTASNGVAGTTRTLAGTRRVVVGQRPDAHAPSGAGTPDRSFGSDGTAQMPFPGYFVYPVTPGLQSDGRLVVGAAGTTVSVSRLNGDGTIDPTFAVGGTLTYSNIQLFSRMALDPDDRIWLAGATASAIGTYPQFTVRRFSPDGELLSEVVPDPALLRVAPVAGQQALFASRETDIVALPDGRVVAAGVGHYPELQPRCSGHSFVARFAADGSLDATFGGNGVFRAPFSGCIVRVVPAGDGGLWVLGTADDPFAAAFLLKLDTAGRPDPAFGESGFVYGAFAVTRPIELPDGKLLVGGHGFTVLRFLPSGLPDTSFGDEGRLPNRTGLPLQMQDLRLDAEGRLILAGAAYVGTVLHGSYPYFGYRPVISRYRVDGSLDTAFGEGGVAMPALLTNSSVDTPVDTMRLLPLPGGMWLLALPGAPSGGGFNTTVYVHRFRGEPDDRRQPVTEFFHAGFGHYFLTADPDEIDALDRGAISGWTRTGQAFSAYANAPGDGADVCRFFSRAFAPKSSHFFTANAAECELVKQYPAWTYEGVGFDAPVPDAGGLCPHGMLPVYRLYNDGQGGAPAHRYTTSLSVRSEMMLAGWVPEGYGPEGVIMCAPW